MHDRTAHTMRRLHRHALAAGLSALFAPLPALAQPAVPSPGGAIPRAARAPTVDTCADAGAGSLRAALATAVDGDVIDLANLSCSTITLTSGLLVTTASVTLQGPGRDLLAIDGNGTGMVLYGTRDLALHGLTVTNGYNADQGTLGACVIAIGDMDLVESRVSNCRMRDTNGDGAYGAGIVAAGELALVSSIVTGNRVESTGEAGGAGIVALGALSLVDSEVSENRAYGYDVRGVGIRANLSAGTSLQDSTVSGNVAFADHAAYGAGVYSNGSIHVSGGSVSANVANSVARAAGGGIFVVGSATVTGGASIAANHANSASEGYGAGIFAQQGSVTIGADAPGINAIVRDNVAGGIKARGGGVFTATGAIDVRHARVFGNRASSGVAAAPAGVAYGGGLHAADAVTLVASSLSGNIASATGAVSSSAVGGGVYGKTVVSARYSTIDGNAALAEGSYGGGIAVSASSKYAGYGQVDLRNTTVSGNAAGSGTATPGIGVGGGVFIGKGMATITQSTIAANAADHSGGGLALTYFTEGAQHLLASTLVAGNTAPTAVDVAGTRAHPAVAFGGERNLVQLAGEVTMPPDTIDADPLLAPLAANGGPTATHALAACSPARDAGSNAAGAATDQRLDGYLRTYGAVADIGAFEWQPDADRLFADGFEPSGCP